MKYLQIKKSTRNYFEQMGLDFINNACYVEYFNGTMRSITAAIDKIRKDNEGTRVQWIATSNIKIVNEKAIMDACVIFDLPKKVAHATSDKSSTKKKVQITEPIKHFCNENGINYVNFSKGAIFFYGNVKHISSAITMIEEANKNLKVKYLQSVTVNEGKEIANACAIFEDNDIVEENYTNDEIVKLTESISLYCDNHDVKISDNGVGSFCITGSMRYFAATISKILEANKDSKVKNLQTKSIGTGTDQETGRDIAIVAASVIFSY